VISAESLNRLYRNPSAMIRHGMNQPQAWLAILTCMDARIHPERSLGVAQGEAHLIRNAGGRASDDAFRSLIVAWNQLGVEEIAVVHHTDCRMTYFTDQQLRDRLTEELSVDASGVEFLTFTDPNSSVRADVKRIQRSSLIPDSITVSGYICDTETGQLVPVVTHRGSRLPRADAH
jgi:carbonic anhydrase